jgi:hypothetical protein
VSKLIKSLTSSRPKRELTCVQFGEKSPTLAVGDNLGTVMVYRILEPVTITHEGPMQQTQKLKVAISKLVDPSNAAKLTALENIRAIGADVSAQDISEQEEMVEHEFSKSKSIASSNDAVPIM